MRFRKPSGNFLMGLGSAALSIVEMIFTDAKEKKRIEKLKEEVIKEVMEKLSNK